MERKSKVGGIIFGFEDYMSVSRNDNEQSSNNKSSDNNSSPIYGLSYSSVLHNLQTYCKIVFNQKRMAEIKFGWLILNMLGLPIYVLGIVNNLDNYKSAILFLMGLLYSVTILMRSYETWRTKKISNDRELFHLENEKKQKTRQQNT